ncbi:unnamed protein product [Symbiodinium sp. CCMP2592]|nr:unnamed protein product [Symbiodinium sp. CCMP2592]
MTRERHDGTTEKIHFTSTKETKDGTTTTKYKNRSRVDCQIGHSTYFEVEESLKGEVFKTRRIGKGTLDKRNLTTEMVHCEKEVLEVRDEVKGAFGQGMEAKLWAANVGAFEIRKANEQKLFVTPQQKQEATLKLAAAMTSQGAAGVISLLASERGIPGSAAAAVAAGGAAFLQGGTAAEKVEHGIAAAGTSLALSAAHEAASGVVGPGFTGNIAGRAAGAFLTSEGSCADRLANAAGAAGEGEGRKGVDFAGGSSLSFGHRDRFGADVKENGTQISQSQHEEGLGTVLSATGAGSLASGIGSAAGVSGNLGMTERVRHEQKPDGGYKLHSETVHGFAGGVDVAGVEQLNLDTGKANVQDVEHEKTSRFSSCTTETNKEDIRILGQTLASKEVAFKQTREGLLGSKTVEADCKTHHVVEESEGLFLTTSRAGSGSVDKMSGEVQFDGEVSHSCAVREEVKEALQQSGAQIAAQGAAGVAGLVAGEVAGKLAGSASAGASLGEALAAGGAAFLQGGTAAEKVEHGIAAAGTSLALSAAHEAASGVVGPGFTGNIAGRAAGAFLTSEGSCADRLANAAGAAGEGALVQAAGIAMVKSGVPLCPMGLINEDGRKGVDFAGGSSLSVGHRDRFGADVKENGTQISQSQHEEGVQLRVGLGTVLSATGAGSLASGIGSAVGVSGNLGRTERVRHEQKPDGSYKLHSETVHGFAGGVDVAGVEQLNLDTGKANVQDVEHEKTSRFSSCTTETNKEDIRILGQTLASKEVAFKQTREGLLSSKKVEVDCKTHHVVEESEGLFLTTSRAGSGSVDKMSGEVQFDGEVSHSCAVREEVKEAAGRGLEVGTREARKSNEGRLFCSAEQEKQALQQSGAQIAAQGAAGVAGLVAGEVAGKLAGSASAGASLGEALAAGGAAFLQGGTAAEKVEHGIAAAGTSLALSAAHEAASGVVGPGFTGNIAGRAAGAFLTSEGSCADRLANAAGAAGEGEGRKGVDFAGGSSLSVGHRDRFGADVKENGTQISQSQHEEGVTERVRHEQKPDGSYKLHSETVHGFAGGVDVAGMEQLNFDTGKANVQDVEHEKTSRISSCTTETNKEDIRILGQTLASKEVAFKQTREGLLSSKKVEVDCKTHHVVEESEGLFLTTSRAGSGSVDKMSGEVQFDGEVSHSCAVREEVKEAAGRGLEVGTREACKSNEGRLFCSAEQEKQALQQSGAQIAAQGAAGVAGLVAGEVAGKLAGSASAGASLGEALAAGGAAFLQGGTAAEKVEHGIAAAGTSLALSAAHEAASGVVGPGFTGNIAGRAAGAFLTSEGSCADRLANAAGAAGEGALVQAAGIAMAKSGVPLCPMGLINEDGRKGVDFAGGSSLSVGHRDSFGADVKENGTQISQSQHEEGVQLRVGLGTVLSATGVGSLASGIGSAVGVSGNLGVTESMRRTQNQDGSYSVHMASVWGFAGSVDVTGVNLGCIHGFGALDTGVFRGVSVHGGTSSKGNFVASAESHWKQTAHAAGVCLMGLRLEVPYAVANSSEQTFSTCGLQWCRIADMHEVHIGGQSGEKVQAFLLLVEVKESYVETWFGASRRNVHIAATAELKGIVGQGTACAIASFFRGRREGKSVGEAISCSCQAFCAAALDGALNVQLSYMAANLSNNLSNSVFSLPAWAALSPYLEDGLAALVRPVVRACLNRGCQLDDFGRDWLKQFVLLQLLRLLRHAGVSSTALQLLSASYSRIFDNLAVKNPNLLELLVDLVPIVLEVFLKAAVSGTPYGWIMAYVVVPLLLELIKCQSIQCVLGNISASVLGCAAALKEWVLQAMAMLRKFFSDIGVAGTVSAVVAGTSAGMAAAAAASTAMAPAASIAGSQTLGSVAVGLGLIASPVAPVGAVLGIASLSGVAAGLVVLTGWRQAQHLIQEGCAVQSWQTALKESSEVEIFVTKPVRRWVKGIICCASTTRLSVKYFLGKEERQVPLARDSDRLRLVGADGATVSVFVPRLLQGRCGAFKPRPASLCRLR